MLVSHDTCNLKASGPRPATTHWAPASIRS